MKRSLLFVALTVVVSGGCKKYRDTPEPASTNNQAGSGFGAEQAVRGAVNRVVTAAEMHDLFIFMHNAKGTLGRVPTAQETWAEISQPSGNRQLAKLIQDGIIVLVPNPQDEGLWAYDKNAPSAGGWITTHSGEERISAVDFNTRFGRNQAALRKDSWQPSTSTTSRWTSAPIA